MYSCARTARVARLTGRLIRQQSDGGTTILSPGESLTSATDTKKKLEGSTPAVGTSKLEDAKANLKDDAEVTPTSFIPQFSSRKLDSAPKSSEVSSQPNVRKLMPKISMYVPPKNLGAVTSLGIQPQSKVGANWNLNTTQTEGLPKSEPSEESRPDVYPVVPTKPFYITQNPDRVKPLTPNAFENYVVEPEPCSVPSREDQTGAEKARKTVTPAAQPVSHGALLDMEKQWNDMVKLAVPFEEMPGPWSFKLIHSILKYVPIIGTQITASSMVYLMEMIGAHLAWQQKVLPFFQLYEQYGPIVRLQGLFGGDIVFLSRPEHIEAVYRQEGRYPVRSSLDSIEQYRLKHRKLRTAGPFIMSGPEWEDLRTKLEAPLKNTVVQYHDMIEAVSDDFVARYLVDECRRYECRARRIRDLRNRQEEVPKHFQSEILKWGLETMGLVAYNKRLGCLAETGRGLNATSEAARLIDAMTTASKSLRACESYIQWWRFFESPSWKKLVSSCDEIDSITSKHIRIAQNRLHAKKDANQSLRKELMDANSRGQPLLETLLLNENMLPEDILTVVLDMMLIGVNSTCHAISFLLYHLARSPRVQRQIYEELRSVMPNKNDKLSCDVLKNLPLLRASVTESLRLNPPIPSITRVLPKDIAIHNYRIPKGTYMVMTSHVACLKEENFEDALKFKPERWLHDDKDIHPFAAIPFGSGLRSCVGRGLAEIQLWMLTAKIIRNFRIEYHYGEIKAKRHFIVMPTKPLKFRFVDRSNE